MIDPFSRTTFRCSPVASLSRVSVPVRLAVRVHWMRSAIDMLVNLPCSDTRFLLDDGRPKSMPLRASVDSAGVPAYDGRGAERRRSGGLGRRTGLKIPRPERAVPVRHRPPA